MFPSGAANDGLIERAYRLNDADVDEDQANRVHHAWKAYWVHGENTVKALPGSIARLGLLGLQMSKMKLL